MAIATISNLIHALKTISMEEVDTHIQTVQKDVTNMVAVATASHAGICGMRQMVEEYLDGHPLVPALFWVKGSERTDKIPNEVNGCFAGLVRIEVAGMLKAITGSHSVMVEGGEGPGVMYNTLVAIYRLADLAQEGALDLFSPFDDIDIAAYRLGEVPAASTTVMVNIESFIRIVHDPLKDILDLLLWVIAQANGSKTWDVQEVASQIKERFVGIRTRQVYQYIKFEGRHYLPSDVNKDW